MKPILAALITLSLLRPALAQTTIREEVVIEGRKARIETTITFLDPPPTPGPAAPTNLAAATVSSGRIDLTWTDNSTDETGFALWRRQTGAWTRLALLAPNTNRYSDWSVGAGGTYTYRVQAVSESGVSAASNELTLVAQSERPPPPPPGSVELMVSGASWAGSGERPATGETVTIHGAGFGTVPGKLQVDFGEYPFEIWTDSEILFRWPNLLPPPPSTVSIRRPDGQWYSGILRRTR